MDGWLETFRPLYGELATGELAAEQKRFVGTAVAASPDEAAEQYRGTIGGRARHALGEYFTPAWLADRVLDRLDYDGAAPLLDPSAGLGVFVERAAARGGEAVGYEINPVTAARARVMGLPVETRDTLCDPGARRFRFIAGNPPWVNWRHINPLYRERIAPLWERYDLLPEGRMGGAMDDLSMLFTFLCADRLLAPGGRMALLLPRTLFQSAGGGRKFRRFELPEARYLRVLSVEEISGASVFKGATAKPVVALFEAGAERTSFPVPYWRDGKRLEARPVSTAEPCSAWIVTRPGDRRLDDVRGRSDYTARVGAHSGGASGVYWIDVLENRGRTSLVRNRADSGRNSWPQITAEIESDLVYSLLRGRDVSRGCAVPSHGIVLPHTPDGRPIPQDVMVERFPRAFAYFEHFRDEMLARPHYRQHFRKRGWPYWSMYNVGAYTFAQHRVVWREQSSRLEAAAIHDPRVIADAKLTVVPCESAEEARYLAAMLNSPLVSEFVESYAVSTQISTHVLRNVHIPRFDPNDPAHRELASEADMNVRAN